jgi:hypothetical protein
MVTQPTRPKGSRLVRFLGDTRLQFLEERARTSGRGNDLLHPRSTRTLHAAEMDVHHAMCA